MTLEGGSFFLALPPARATPGNRQSPRLAPFQEAWAETNRLAAAGDAGGQADTGLFTLAPAPQPARQTLPAAGQP